MTEQPNSAKELFLRALAVPDAAARRNLLEAECRGNQSLRNRVEALLHAHGRSGGAVDRLAPEAEAPSRWMDELQGPTSEEIAAQELAHTSASSLPGAGGQRSASQIASGETIGPYTLLEPIGAGGMGSVWRARQERPVQREVALKLIKPGLDTELVLRRFEAERRTLAWMDHPHIAKVLDAGETPDHRPYFVMEWVRGQPIAAYCDSRRLSLARRLDLFSQACQAIQHAHQKGIIHRDIKSTNVLVAEYDGQALVKVIDFGVAKAMGDSVGWETAQTGVGAIVGTLECMSPEQAVLQPHDIDTRSDVYSLGVLLYELLCGERPLDANRLRNRPLPDLLRAIREEDAPRPSQRLASHAAGESLAAGRSMDRGRLVRALSGELDWITMKCLEKDREHRYETVAALNQDIQAFLHDEPVLAGPPSRMYRLGKLVRRHRTLFAASALLLLVLSLGVMGTSAGMAWAFRERRTARIEKHKAELAAEAADRERAEAQRQKARAEDNFQRARQAVDAYLSRVAQSPQLDGPLLPLRRQLLEAAQPFYEELLAQRDDAEMQYEVVHATLCVGAIQQIVGHGQEALASYERALQLLENAKPAEGTDPTAHRRQLADCLNRLGLLQMERREYPAALRLLERAVQASEQAASAAGESDFSGQVLLATAYDQLGLLHTKIYQPEKAVPFFQKSLDAGRAVAAREPEQASHQSSLGATWNNLATAHMMRGDLAASEASLREAVRCQSLAVAASPDSSQYLQFLGNHQYNLGQLQLQQGDRDGAGESFQAARQTLEQLTSLHPSIAQGRLSLARTLLALAGLSENADEATLWLTQAERMLRQLLAIDPQGSSAASHLAQVLDSLARRRRSGGRLQEAAAAWSEAAALLEKLPEEDPLNAASHRSNRARCLLLGGDLRSQLGDLPTAVAEIEEARRLYEQFLREKPDDPTWRSYLSQCHNSLGLLYGDAERFAEAEASLRAAVASWGSLAEQFPGDADYRVEQNGGRVNLANLFARQGDFATATSWYQQAEEALRDVVRSEPGNKSARSYLSNSALGWTEALTQVARRREAIEVLNRVIPLLTPQETPRLLLSRAQLRQQQGELPQAAEDADRLEEAATADAALAYDLARLHAGISEAIALDASLAEEARREAAERHARRAVARLRKLLDSGATTIEAVRDDQAFQSLLDRDDVRLLLSPPPDSTSAIAPSILHRS